MPVLLHAHIEKQWMPVNPALLISLPLTIIFPAEEEDEFSGDVSRAARRRKRLLIHAGADLARHANRKLCRLRGAVSVVSSTPVANLLSDSRQSSV